MRWIRIVQGKGAELHEVTLPGFRGVCDRTVKRFAGLLSDAPSTPARTHRVARSRRRSGGVAAVPRDPTATIALRGLGTRRSPYPYALAEGRAAHGSDEAVAGQGLLDLLKVHVGDWVRMTVDDQPQILHIVGRSIEPENADRVTSTSLDTLRENDPHLAPPLYQLRPRPGADLRAVVRRLTAAGHGQLDVHAATNPADELSPLRGVVAGLILVLPLIGLVEVLTAIGGTIREGERDLPAWKARRSPLPPLHRAAPEAGSAATTERSCAPA